MIDNATKKQQSKTTIQCLLGIETLEREREIHMDLQPSIAKFLKKAMQLPHQSADTEVSIQNIPCTILVLPNFVEHAVARYMLQHIYMEILFIVAEPVTPTCGMAIRRSTNV